MRGPTGWASRSSGTSTGTRAPMCRGSGYFTANNRVALADASLRWGRLWRQGLPYSTLLLNNINHPDERGMRLFADALMEVFP